MIVDQTGTLASVKRHDYLPFGEEIGGPDVALLGGRTTAQGYTGDATRQKFTGYEADAETGLNFAQARYQSPTQGRFTSVDPLGASASVGDPQSFNRYSYVNNNPVNLTDPSGMMTPNPASGMMQTDDEYSARTLQASSDAKFKQDVNKDAAARARPPTRRFNEFAGSAIRATYGGNAAAGDGRGGIDFSSGGNEFAGGAREDETPLTLGIAIAQQRIAGCPAIFKKGNGSSVFNGIVASGGIVTADAPIFDPITGKQDRLINNPELYAVTGGGKIFFNPVGPLSDGRWKNESFMRGLSEAEAFAVILMHETAHGTGDFPPDNPKQSVFNSLMIRVVCFPDKPLR